MIVSIIVAAKAWSSNLEECIYWCSKLNYPDLEIIIVTDKPVEPRIKDSRIKIISAGPLRPADKRDIAAKEAKGDILAFIDDDAYPREDWLENALKDFSDIEIAAVGGPGLTPCDDSLLEQASGLIYSSFLVGGAYRYRYIQEARRFVDDYPSCNFFVRKSAFSELGGFNTSFWPGEDTKLCLGITKGLGKKIIYDPEVVVYHHRRPLFAAHLKQVAAYALHRGYFAKRFPQTSFRIAYFIPTLFLAGICLGSLVSSLVTSLKIVYFAVLASYLLIVFIFSAFAGLRMMLLLAAGIILTHLIYGFYFLKGLMSPKLVEEI